MEGDILKNATKKGGATAPLLRGYDDLPKIIAPIGSRIHDKDGEWIVSGGDEDGVTAQHTSNDKFKNFSEFTCKPS